MIRSTKSSFLEDALDPLVRHFGVVKVRNALEKVSVRCNERPRKSSGHPAFRDGRETRPPISSALDSIRGSHPDKHQLLSDFHKRLIDRNILPESQDIRQFAQLVGLKEIRGKSRRDLIPPLMHFLLGRPLEQLQIELEGAAGISEQQRRQGYSVLTDKLLKEG